MHSMGFISQTSVDRLAEAFLNKISDPDQLHRKTQLRSMFVAKSIKLSDAKNNDSIDKRIADRLILMTLETLLFPVDIPSSAIYRLTGKIIDSIVFGYSEDIPEISYMKNEISSTQFSKVLDLLKTPQPDTVFLYPLMTATDV